MGSPSILYFGADECLRIPVLQVAGFRVQRCASLAHLERHLAEAPAISAVIFEEERGKTADTAAELTRRSSVAVRVLFRHPDGDSAETHFDLVIDPATPPDRWLQQLAGVLLARVSGKWAEVARELQARRRDLPADPPSDSAPGFRIQPERRKCT